jgi:hypothetical protein
MRTWDHQRFVAALGGVPAMEQRPATATRTSARFMRSSIVDGEFDGIDHENVSWSRFRPQSWNQSGEKNDLFKSI